jgi:hypothetical protein
MVIKEIRKSPIMLKKYFSTFFIILFLLYFLNYYGFEKIIIPFFFDERIAYSGVFKSIIEDITSIGTVAFFGAAFYWWTTPSGISEGDVNVVYSHDIKSTLSTLVQDTEYFYYLGHTARWNRSVSLPILRDIAEKSRTTKIVELVILDPRNENLCDFYINQAFSRRKEGLDLISIVELQVELVATIFKALELNQSNFVDCKVYLSNSVTISRFDISQKGILLSKPYKGDPAIFFPANTFFYNSYKEEYRVAKSQANLFEPNEMCCKSISIKSIQGLVGQLNLHVNDTTFCEKVLTELQKKNDYY